MSLSFWRALPGKTCQSPGFLWMASNLTKERIPVLGKKCCQYDTKIVLAHPISRKMPKFARKFGLKVSGLKVRRFESLKQGNIQPGTF